MDVYNSSKHAVVAITETLYHDLRLAGAAIGVSLLYPAFVLIGIADAKRSRPASLVNDAPYTASQKLAALIFDAVREGRSSTSSRI